MWEGEKELVDAMSSLTAELTEKTLLQIDFISVY